MESISQADEMGKTDCLTLFSVSRPLGPESKA